MKVCTINKSGDEVLLDGVSCSSANEAYIIFRERYNRALGKATYKRIGRAGDRVERITSVGINFNKEYSDALREEFKDEPVYKCYILGLFGSSYCRMLQDLDIPFDDDNKVCRFVDWLLAAGMNNTRLCGRKDSIVRTLTKKVNKNGRN